EVWGRSSLTSMSRRPRLLPGSTRRRACQGRGTLSRLPNKVAHCANVGYDHEKISCPLALLEGAMRTVQMTLDDALVQEIDQVVKELGTTRSAFAREAFRAAIAHVRRQAMEIMHREGYARHPVQPGEFSDWENEQV